MSCRIICNPNYASSPADIEAELMDDSKTSVHLAHFYDCNKDDDLIIAFSKITHKYICIDDDGVHEINNNTITRLPHNMWGFQNEWEFHSSCNISKMLILMYKNRGKVPQIEEWVQAQNFK